MFFWIGAAALAVIGGWLIRSRARAGRGGAPRVTDDVVRSIERGDPVEAGEEPLDRESIREEEERFWDDWEPDIEEW